MPDWPEDWTERKRGVGCAMCAQGSVEDNEFGLRFARGAVSEAHLQRVSWTPGYSVVIWTGRHVADATELTDDEATAYWRDVLAAARVVEGHYRPAKLNLLLLLLGNALPHLHAHIVPRYVGDPAPGQPLPFPEEDAPPIDEDRLRNDVAALRQLAEAPR